ncbi:hypothetical protein COU15_00400 [Candidatus Kaiserbacteria bacterium CG10_big_fil_rev_8_21_14_0_10_45_20]|uniref:DUF8128 domain-containing protein n=1 Tax=Candidatus Kaiserbacteria bacterium CG10_big_fil_rev_8_21_14_0_10_45_20 TaxID=1974607 RepID=A0A2H0UGL7_9BACT|nr:MAG: hypothetical protein COU15_00400 [Candidatus Kaiserbacteria bacterium CG10_big_fil_rev_8_21_14_0_10_45_20]
MRIVLRFITLSLLLVIPIGIWLAPGVVAFIFGGIFFLSPLWLPILLTAILIPLWLVYVRSQYVSNIPYTVLELKPGLETPKTARAMELVFYSLYHRSHVSWKESFFIGKMRMPWSFELMAHNGEVRFFMRVPTSHRATIESRIRSEYRDIDIDQTNDYIRQVAFDSLSMKLAVSEYTLGKPDPYPLKTYEAYESVKKAEDPFLNLVESLASLKNQEYFCISYIVRPHQRDREKFWKAPEDTLHGDAEGEIGNIIGSQGDVRSLPDTKKRVVEAIEEALTKPAFDVGVRAVYFAPRSQFDDVRAESLNTLFDEFSDPNLNVLVPKNPREAISWPLSDIFSAVPPLESSYLFDLYKRRAFFAPPYYGDSFVLNTAEFATIFHIPHIVRTSPLANKNKLEPPENVPHMPIS